MNLSLKVTKRKKIYEKPQNLTPRLTNYRSEGKLPYTKFGPSIVYKVLDIVDFLERNKIQKAKKRS